MRWDGIPHGCMTSPCADGVGAAPRSAGRCSGDPLQEIVMLNALRETIRLEDERVTRRGAGSPPPNHLCNESRIASIGTQEDRMISEESRRRLLHLPLDSQPLDVTARRS
jgi:hypothetical protein